MRLKTRLKWAVLPIALVSLLSLSGCAEFIPTDASRGFLPGVPGVTNQTDRIVNLWNGSWIVLLGVGIVAWGLMAFAAIVYRRRKGDNSIPVQLRYNMPIETLFTVIPLILVIGFFAFTVRDMNAIEAPVTPVHTIQAVGKQWSWDFNYVDQNTYETGIQSQFAGETGSEKSLPTLWLPVNKAIEFDLTSRDVIHSFWIVDFLYKKDVFPGRTNKFWVTPQVESPKDAQGNYIPYKGKCAELCGEYHSMMLFNVIVSSQADFDKHMRDLRAQGNSGQLPADPLDPNNLNRNGNLPGDNPSVRG